MAADAKMLVPCDAGESASLIADRLDDSGFMLRKGPYVKHMRFFSYLEAAAFYDKWTGLRGLR